MRKAPYPVPDMPQPAPKEVSSEPDGVLESPSASEDKRPPGNLPLELSSFVGRRKEIAELRVLLAGSRLLTLTGPGGSGKTRLALAVAHEVVGKYEDGAWFVELAPLSDPELVPQAVASVLGVREVPGRPLVATLSDHLRSRTVLLVLDNCEHLLDASASLAEALLRSCPNLRVLATSRQALGVEGEIFFLVPPLSLPDPRRLPAVDGLSDYEAARLFVERASAANPTFALTDRNAFAVAQICHRLEGMPLAIELAAARARMLPAEQIASRLEGSFALLARGGRTAVARHGTLRATMDWSHELLSKEERILFRRLSVFAGGFTLGATEETCSGEGIDKDDVLDLISHVVDKSLVVVRERGGEMRYRLLETVRQYAWEKLVESGEAEVVRRRHANCFHALAEEAEPNIEPNVNIAERRPWLERLEIEHDNLRAALRWAEENSPEKGIRLAGALYWLWYYHGYQSEARGWYEGALAEAPAVQTEERAWALSLAGYLAWVQGDHAAARSRLEEGVKVYRELGGGQSGLAHALWILGLEMLDRGEPAAARSLAEESVEIFRAIGDGFGLSVSLANLGAILLAQGDYTQATTVLEESVAVSREAQDDWMLSLPLRNLGVAAYQQGDYDRTEAVIGESLVLLRGTGDRFYISLNLECLAAADAMRGDHVRAARLFGARDATREAIGVSALSYVGNFDGAVGAARDALGEEAFAAEWTEGRAMSPDQAVEYALEPTATTGEPASRSASYPAGLSAREVEVLRLVARGLTNARIAQELYISPRTVNTHLTSAYRKTGSSTRVEAAGFAQEHGLL